MRILLAALVLALTPVAGAACEEGRELPEWMTGAWGREDDTGWADEYWTPARGGMMIGASRSGKGEKLTFWEHMRIEKEADGTIVFWAIAGDQKPVRFVAREKTAEEIVFVNPDHDYPQRIHYWREGKALNAEISLIDGSKAVQFSFKLIGG
jgi:Domain of unknown function (DUF6265)